LNRGAGPGQLVVMTRDLHGHPAFNITLGALEHFQTCHLVLGVEVEHVLRRFLVEEGAEPTDNLPLIAAFFDALEKLLLACGGDVGLWLCHRSGSFGGNVYRSVPASALYYIIVYRWSPVYF